MASLRAWPSRRQVVADGRDQSVSGGRAGHVAGGRPAPAAAGPSTTNSAAISVGEHLRQEAAAFGERGDTNNALARLQEAVARDPKNANVLAEMAMIYESMQLLDRSNETWRKIQEDRPVRGRAL